MNHLVRMQNHAGQIERHIDPIVHYFGDSEIVLFPYLLNSLRAEGIVYNKCGVYRRSKQDRPIPIETYEAEYEDRVIPIADLERVFGQYQGSFDNSGGKMIPLGKTMTGGVSY
jgi:hypothetical protein